MWFAVNTCRDYSDPQISVSSCKPSIRGPENSSSAPSQACCQHITTSIWKGIGARIFCILFFTYRLFRPIQHKCDTSDLKCFIFQMTVFASITTSHILHYVGGNFKAWPPWVLLILKLFLPCVYVCGNYFYLVCMCECHNAQVEVSGQFSGVDSVLPPCGSWGLT